MVKYTPPPLDRRIQLAITDVLPEDTDSFGQESPEPRLVTVWANRRDSNLAVEEVGDSAQVVAGGTVWTIRERNVDGLEYVVDKTGRRFYIRAPAREVGGANAGMRSRYLELITERRSG